MDVESLYRKGKEAADVGNYDYAIAMLLDVVIEHPDHIEARLALRACEEQVFGRNALAKLSAVLKGLGPLVKIYTMGGKPRVQMVACERFLVNWPSCGFVLLRLANALHKLDHVQAAISTLEYAVHRQPQNTRALWALAVFYEEIEDYAKASRCLESVLRYKPTDDEAKRKFKDLQSMAHMAKTRLDEGVDSMQTVRDMETARKLLASEQIVKTVDQIDHEIGEIQAALQQTPDNAAKWVRLGDLYLQQDKVRLALQAYEKSYELDPRYQTREKVGDVHLRIHRDAERKAREEAQAAPGDEQARARYAEVRLRRAEHAVEEFEFRVKEHPTEVRLCEPLGDAYLARGREGDLDKATLQYQRAVTDPRIKSRVHRKLGACFARNPATYDMALAQYERARKATVRLVEQQEIDYDIGAIYERLGRFAQALDAYKRIYEMDAGFRDVAQKVLELTPKAGTAQPSGDAGASAPAP